MTILLSIDVLSKVPRLYSTEEVKSDDKIVYLHFFSSASDWYIVEYDGKDTFFGFAILNGDLENAEWGYVSFSELKTVRYETIDLSCSVIEYDKDFTPTPFKDIYQDVMKRYGVSFPV